MYPERKRVDFDSIYVLILLTKIDLQYLSEAGSAGMIRVTHRRK